MKVTCPECSGNIDVPDDAVTGEIVSCPDCGMAFEVSDIGPSGVSLKIAESVGEDWGE